LTHFHRLSRFRQVVEPWAGGYCDPKLSVAARSNYAQREELLALKRTLGPRAPTALVTHGANPGLVSHFVKQALLNVAAACRARLHSGEAPIRATGGDPAAFAALLAHEPTCRAEWAALASALGVRTIHISERDSQAPGVPKAPGEFVNTWSVDGFISEGGQPAELGWGTHEKALPPDGARHAGGSGAAIYLQRPGAGTRVRTWAPGAGAFHGFLVTHNEAISIADYLTLWDLSDDGAPGVVRYRPTVHYAYHPCDAALASLHELAGRNYEPQGSKRLLGPSDIVCGSDELGVLLGGLSTPLAPAGAYWFGSQLSAAAAAAAAPANSATTLQVTSAVLGGLVWALEHPCRGVVEPEEVCDWRRVLDIAAPYVAPLVGRWTEWTPLAGRGAAAPRGALFPEQLDEEDAWQFANVRVA
jgi:homospermidine synthase